MGAELVLLAVVDDALLELEPLAALLALLLLLLLLLLPELLPLPTSMRLLLSSLEQADRVAAVRTKRRML